MIICSKCNKENTDETKFCAYCGNLLSQDTPPAAETPAPVSIPAPVKQKKKMLAFLLPALIGVVVLVAALLVVGFFTNWFGLVSPLNGLIKAAEKTINAESLTAIISQEDSDSEATVELRLVLNEKEKDITLIADLESSYSYDDEDYNYTQKHLIYKGDYYYYSEDADDDVYAYTEEESIDEKEIFKTKDKIYNEEKEIDWDEIVDLLDADDYIDSKEIQPFLKEFYKEYLTNSKWLKNSAGFEKKGSTYTFRPELEDFAEELCDICTESEMLTKDARKTLKNLLKESDFLGDYEVEISFTVKKGYISKIDFKAEGEKGKETTISLELKDVNKTKIEESEIKKLRNEIEDVIAENTCDECGDWVEDKDKHGDCPECGEHGYIGYGDGVCWDCDNVPSSSSYYGYGYCNNCGWYTKTYLSYYDHTFCADCYDDDYFEYLDYGYCYHCSSYEELYNDYECWDCW